MPALFSWADYDGDGRLDLAAVTVDGRLQLLANAGEGRLEDVTQRVGLSGIANVALALWADYDSDLRLDLFVGARQGASRLFHNEGGTFVDMSAGSGLLVEGAVQSADWLDLDGDGRLDLHVVTAERHQLFRGLEGGFFEATELPRFGATSSASSLNERAESSTVAAPSGGSPGSQGARGAPTSGGSAITDEVRPSGSRAPMRPALTIGPGPGSRQPIGGSSTCLDEIEDKANPGACLKASTTPTLGRLYPVSVNLFVAVGGNVGIGTTSPGAKLEVAGTARITDTLTLNPSSDQALDVSTGSIYKGGVLFIHTKGGFGDTALGAQALSSVTTGSFNTAIGSGALRYNTTGYNNTASGAMALVSNTTGNNNTASGLYALRSSTTGSFNTAIGSAALVFNTTGHHNIAVGTAALLNNTTGYRNTGCGYLALGGNGTGNIALGYRAGRYLTTGNDNIAIGNNGVAAESATIRMGTAGTHTRAFIAGIRGVTTDVANAIPVVVDSAGQLGTVSSSRRFKKDIADMGDLTDKLLELRPVVFHYKQEQTLPNGAAVPLEYGLIAEEVAEIFPDLVVYDEEGQPFTVKYHILSSMLLNEVKKQHEQLEAQSERLRALEALARDHARETEELRTSLAAIASRTSPDAMPVTVHDR